MLASMARAIFIASAILPRSPVICEIPVVLMANSLREAPTALLKSRAAKDLPAVNIRGLSFWRLLQIKI